MGRRGISTLLAITAVSSALFLLTRVSASADPSPWFGPEPLKLENLRTLPPGQLPPYSINGNRDCEQRKVVTLPFRAYTAGPDYQEEQSHQSCVENGSYGGVSETGYLQFNGTHVAGRKEHPNGAKMTGFPVPKSDIFVQINSSANTGVYLKFIHDFSLKIGSQATSFGNVTHKLKQDYEHRWLRDDAGNLLRIKYDSISFSPNGKWMVAESPFLGVIRVNTETLEYLPFDFHFNHASAVAPLAQTAITNDGRYAVVASKTYTRFKLFDLHDCQPIPAPFSQQLPCRHINLYTYMKGELKGFESVSHIRFINNQSIRFYSTYLDEDNRRVTSLFVLRPESEPLSRFGYLALGDSFASGEGAHDYKAVTDTKLNKCHLSQRSYPYLLASELSINSAESVACSGAVIADVWNESADYVGQAGDALPRSQYGEATDILQGFLPGYLAQRDFVIDKKPSIVTLSASGNDVGFAAKILRCIEPDTCYNTYEDRMEIVMEIDNQFPRLVELYTDIKRSLDPRAKIYVIGYPQLAVPAKGGFGQECAANVRLNNTELEFSQHLASYLNKVIAAAAKKAGVYYVDVEHALAGHRHCETTPSNVAVNGVTAGRDKLNLIVTQGPIGNESFHPNALGHWLMKNAIREKTADFTALMPDPDPGAGLPDGPEPGFFDVERIGRKLNHKNFDNDMGNNVAYRASAWNGVITGAKMAAMPFAPVYVALYSERRDLGEFTTDENGDLEFDVTIPEDIEPGYHTMSVQTMNRNSEPIEFYKVVYVAHSEDDFDGDGIPNDQETDGDGIDDACDGHIGEPVAAGDNPKDWVDRAERERAGHDQSAMNESVDEEGADERSLAHRLFDGAVSQVAAAFGFGQTTADEKPDELTDQGHVSQPDEGNQIFWVIIGTVTFVTGLLVWRIVRVRS
jgi:hypothetical protein